MKAAGPIVALAALCALLLALPGATVTTIYVNDLLIFLDGAHRIVWGQVPNRDFHTALGPLVYYVPAAGYALSGTLGGAVPAGMAVAVAALAPAIAYVVSSRLRPAVAVPFGAFLVLVVAMPANLGDGLASLSFAMFYNRIGWAALAALLVMYVPARAERPHREVLDALAAGALTAAMLYVKVTYAVVAVAFISFLLFDPRQRRWAAATIVVTALIAVVVELFWWSSLAHLADLRLVAQVSGVRPLDDLVEAGLRHIPDIAVAGILVVPAMWRTRSLRDAAFYAFCAGAGFLVLHQNAQGWGVLSLHAAVAVAAETLLRSQDDEPHRLGASGVLAAGAPLVVVAVTLPTILHAAAALLLHATLASARAGESFGLPKLEEVRLVRLWTPGEHALSRAYVESLRDGARELAALRPKPSRVSVLDFANGLSAGLDLPPPRGDSAWLHWGRNVDERHFLPPDHLFGDVEVVMVPKWGVNHAPLFALYGPYVMRAFEPVRESAGWTVYRRPGRPPPEREGPAARAAVIGDARP